MMNRTGRIIGIVLMLALGVVLLYLAFQSSKLFLFLNGLGEQIGCGAFLILAGVMNLFHRKK